jgi:hypothetical protein
MDGSGNAKEKGKAQEEQWMSCTMYEFVLGRDYVFM